jgi:hypothetical protein
VVGAFIVPVASLLVVVFLIELARSLAEDTSTISGSDAELFFIMLAILLAFFGLLKMTKSSSAKRQKVEGRRQQRIKEFNQNLDYYDSHIAQKAAELRKSLAI